MAFTDSIRDWRFWRGVALMCVCIVGLMYAASLSKCRTPLSLKIEIGTDDGQGVRP